MSEPNEPRGVGDVWSVRPEQVEKLAPCQAGCPIGTDIRGWIGIVAQRKKLGYSREEAYTRAWEHLVDFNPFPSTTGRVCPHPCTAGCNRGDKDGAVSINAMERFLGDWAIEKDLQLPRMETDVKPESIGVVGGGPAGLSFAYQMARRGYQVTIYEGSTQPGGMLQHGIPRYRLPKDVLRSEIDRVLRLGVSLEVGVAVGRDVTVEELKSRHDVVFLGIGAQAPRRLGIPGEVGPGCWMGTAFLNKTNRGEAINLGRRVVVVGGGNTAIDAARAARRSGSEVTVLYRRTRAEMPANETEIEDARKEDVEFKYLVAPVEIERNSEGIRSIVVQEMELGEPDDSGRRSPKPIDGSEYEMEVDSVIVAVAQRPDWSNMEGFELDGKKPGAGGFVVDGVWVGGDVVETGIAGMAIAQGRQAAEEVHARLRGLPPPEPDARPPIATDGVKIDHYERRSPIEPPHRPVEEWLTDPDREIHQTISEMEFLAESRRCFSCGLCFGCEHCATYCNPSGYTRLEEVGPGAYFSLQLDACEGCRKCIEVCPCGYLSAT